MISFQRTVTQPCEVVTAEMNVQTSPWLKQCAGKLSRSSGTFTWYEIEGEGLRLLSYICALSPHQICRRLGSTAVTDR